MSFREEIVPLKISNLIRQQFPDWYIEHGEMFISFMEAYYEWLELEGNALFYSRNYYNIKDIDNTLDEFIIYFKEKYLKNIQLDTKSQTQQLVKHCLDIYRSKGTERCVRLLFQLVFNKNVNFYYPSIDLFKLSDGVWYKPIYLELQLSEDNVLLVSKQVRGVTTGAIAYVDSVIRRRTNRRLQDIAYISAISGYFLLQEKVQPIDSSIGLDKCPVITGSLSAIDVKALGTGENYKVGDTVSVTSTYGTGGVGLVAEVYDQFGIVNSRMLDGGYGYQANVNDTLYISNTMLTISNLIVANTGAIQYFHQFDPIVQEQAYITYRSATGNFAENEEIFTYYANAAVQGRGMVLSVSSTNATAGVLLAGVISGNLANSFYTTGNVVTANLAISNGYFQNNASGKFMANDDFVVIKIDIVTGAFANGEGVYQPSALGTITRIDGDNLFISVDTGIFKPDYRVIGRLSGAVATVNSLSVGIGLSNTVGTFYAYANNLINAPSVSGTISRIELGTGYAMTVSNNLLNSETIRLNTDLLATYANTNLNAVSYGLPANSSANATTVNIDAALSYVNATIGQIETMVRANPGEAYTKVPFVVLDSPTRSLQYESFALSITNPTAAFRMGELVTQASSNARGTVISTEPNKVLLQNMRFYSNNWFTTTANAASVIVSSGGATANVTEIFFVDSPNVMGHNVVVDSDFIVGRGAILELAMVDSGFGFLPNEALKIGTNGVGTAVIRNQGVASGYYKQKGGFLSDQKKLFDGYFWQNYSYQILSALTMKKYEKMLKQLTHPAGTIMFGELHHDTYANNQFTLEKTIITLS